MPPYPSMAPTHLLAQMKARASAVTMVP